MKHLFKLLVVLFFLLPSSVVAEVKEIVAEGTYNMGDGETPSVAENRALLNAKRVALEQAGTYVESYSRVKNFTLTEDEVRVLASGMMEIVILDKQRTVVGDGFHFWVKIQAKVNPDKIEEMAKNIKYRSVIEDYKKIQREYEKNQQEMIVLKEQLAKAKEGSEKQKVETKITDEERLFQANEWFEKGYRNTVNNETGKAIEDYSKAISLNPEYAEAYNNRGIAYYNSGVHSGNQRHLERAMQDFGKVIALKPNSYSAHFAQGAIYIQKEQYDKAIEEMNKAIFMNPEEGVAYVGRGFIYLKMKPAQIDKAVADFDKVIAMGSLWTAMAFSNRGAVWVMKNQYDKAIEDLNKAIDLGPGNVQAYIARGIAFFLKKQYNRATEDLNRAVELNPNNSDAYLKRGMVYAQIGNPRAISDFQKACDMGNEQGCNNFQILLKNR